MSRVVRAQSRTKTQSEDALQSQDKLIGRKMLSREAQRISNILGNCISQIEFAATLPAIAKFSTVSSDIDEGLCGALQKYQTLVKKLGTLEALKTESHEKQEEIDGEKRFQLDDDYRNVVRNLLRHARAHPAHLNAIYDLGAKEKMELGESESMLIEELKKFHSHMKVKLLTSVDEELVLCKPVRSSPTIENTESKEEEIDAEIELIEKEVSYYTGVRVVTF